MAQAHEHHGIAVEPQRAMYLQVGQVILAADPLKGDQWSELIVRVERLSDEQLELTLIDCLAGPGTMGECAERRVKMDDLEIVPLVVGTAPCGTHGEDD